MSKTAQLEKVHDGSVENADLHVIFVHGLNPTGANNQGRTTWMHDPTVADPLWPRWLTQDCDCGAWLYLYEAHGFAWTGDGMSLEDQGKAFLNCLRNEVALQGKDLLLIGHSLGGLVIKSALLHASTTGDSGLKLALHGTKGVAFLGTPHRGAHLAALAKAFRFPAATNQVLKDISSGNTKLVEINDHFKALFNERSLQGRSLYETEKVARLWGFIPLPGVMVVPKESADPLLNANDAIPIGASDHAQIARPTSRTHATYTTIKALVEAIKQRSTPPTQTLDGEASPPWPELPDLAQAPTDAERQQLLGWSKAPTKNWLSWALKRYATLRLRRLGDEGAGHESFVNLLLQPTRPDRDAASSKAATNPTPHEPSPPVPFASLDALLASSSGPNIVWLLKGSPGAGKSTLLLDLELRRLHAAIDHWRAARTGKPEICLSLSLADFDATPTDLRLDSALPQRWVQQAGWVSTAKPTTASDGPMGVPWQALQAVADLRLLVDGLNEIKATTPAQRKDFNTALHAWLTRCVASPQQLASILTVRQLNYQAFRSDATHLATVRVVDVQGWTHAQILDYCDKRFPGKGNPVWAALQALPDHQRLGLLELFANPFNLAVQCTLFRVDGRLARNRSELLGRTALLRLRDALAKSVEEVSAAGLVDAALDPSTISNHADKPDGGYLHTLHIQGSLLQSLAAIGLAMHTTANGGWGQQALNAGDAIAMRAASAMNLATHHANGTWQFSHQLWQEYFAAWALSQGDAWKTLALQAPPLDDVPPDVWELPQPNPSPWDQCLQMAVAMAPTDTALAMLEHLHGVNLALSARALLARGDVVADGDKLDAVRRATREALLARSTKAGSDSQPIADVRLRVEAGLLLGDLGDDIRYSTKVGTTGKPYIVPTDDRLIAIPSGTFSVGGLKDYQNSFNTVPVTIKRGIRMAFAPVTNAEYRCFVEDGGYGNAGDAEPPPWWQGEEAVKFWRGETPNESLRSVWVELRKDWNGGQGRQQTVARFSQSYKPEAIEQEILTPLALSDEDFNAFVDHECAPQSPRDSMPGSRLRFNNPIQPVVDVSCWEAQAYCRWLSKRLGKNIRLPTEAEWEVAARGGTARGVDWPGQAGGGPQPSTVNNADVRLRSTSPVGCFPAGNTPAPGFVDLCGQVWEWTNSAYSAAGLDESLVNSEAASNIAETRAVRGGAWLSPAVDCRAAIRLRFHPVNRNFNLGFRWVVCPIP
jgi:formylglycine-generating enzyme required for sulfatase activity